MRKNILILLVLLGSLKTGDLLAQPNIYGVPMITNYEHSITTGSEQNWCITQDLRGIVYVGNNDKGVLEYDGVEWRNIPVPNNPIVRSIITGDNGVVYVGATSEFGYLSPDGIGNLQYRSISDTIDQEAHPFSGVWKTYYNQGKVYFCTFNEIFIYDPELGGIEIINTTEFAWFPFFIDNTLYLGDFGQGLMRYNGNEFELVPGGEAFFEMLIWGLEKFDDNRLLVGTQWDGMFLFDTRTGEVDNSFVDPELNEYFQNGEITCIVPINEDFAVATMYNGLVILKRDGKAREMITEAEGFDDQTITYVYSNERLKGSGPVWVTNYMGIGKLEANSPFRVFTETSGFENFISDIETFNGNLFISTAVGLYYKSSTSTSTGFIPISQIQDDLRQLHVFKPSPRVELLLAFSESTAYVIDRNMRVTTIADNVINPPENPTDREEYSGMNLVQHPMQPDVIYTGRRQIIGLKYERGKWREISRIRNLPEEQLRKMVIDKFGYLWTSTEKRVIRLDISVSHNATMKFFVKEDGLPTSEKNQVFTDPETDEIMLGTMDGFYRYNYFRDTLYRDTVYNKILPPGTNLIHAFHTDRDGDHWFSFENESRGWTELMARRTGDELEILKEKSFQRLPEVSVDVFYDDQESGVWLSKSNELYHFDKSFSRIDTLPFRTIIRSVIIGSDSLLYYGTNFREKSDGGFSFHLYQDENAQPEILHRYNNIEFRWAAPFFEQEDKLEFSYRLYGFNDDWSDWSEAVYQDFTNLPFGQYTLFVKAKNVYGVESAHAAYAFTILRPWYATVPAIIAYIILSGLLIFIAIKLYTRRLMQENIRLEGIIEERTAEIRKQKEELTDSIEYASRIQRALLPPDRLMDQHNIEHFILFRPRDIVSGDFYWMGSKNGKILIVAADCTGHGVPGAFMSMLGMTFLDEIVIKSEITNTAEILEHLREHVITSLKQSGKSMEESTKDGMDLAMIALDKDSNKIQYSGAYNPLYLVRKLKRGEKTKLNNGEELDLARGSIHDEEHLLLQIRADQMPIGISEKTQPFTETSFKDEGYNIYMFSDGFLDQFGGPQGKKFMSKNFKKMILELQSIPLQDQGAALEKVLMGWMGEISQIDDILVMGLRMNPS